jgi:hypothetical protein
LRVLRRLLERLRRGRDGVIKPSREDRESASKILEGVEAEDYISGLEQRLEELRRRLKKIEEGAGTGS